jgi:hypothetical protein
MPPALRRLQHHDGRTAREPRGATLVFLSGSLIQRSIVMQSEIAPPIEPDDDATDRMTPVVGALELLNEALAACLDEIESLQQRVARLEREREAGAT